MREVSDYDNALRGNYKEREIMSKGDLYCKMLKKGNGMGKRTLIGEDALSLSDDNNNNNNNNVDRNCEEDWM